MRIPPLLLACYLLAWMAAEPSLLSAQSQLPGYEPLPEGRKSLEENLSWKELQKLKYAEQVVRRREVFGELIAKYPQERSASVFILSSRAPVCIERAYESELNAS